MATKSFTTDMKFSRKSVTNLLSALENNKKPNINKSIKASNVSDISEIKHVLQERKQVIYGI